MGLGSAGGALIPGGDYTFGTVTVEDGLASSAAMPYAAGVAEGYKVARGATALDGSNPTTVATGLTTVVAFTATLVRNSALSSGTAFITHGTPSAGNVDVYGWVLAGTASTGTETFSWVAVGT